MELPPRSASPLAAASRVEPVIASGADLAAGKSGGRQQPEQLYSSSADEMQAQEVSSGSRRKKKTRARDPPAEEKKVPGSYLPNPRHKQGRGSASLQCGSGSGLIFSL